MLFDRMLKDSISIFITELILTKNCTIRQCSEELGYSKSYVHKFIHTYIYNNHPDLYKEIKKVLDEHNKIKHINGGNATKLLWEKRRNKQLNT